MVNILYNYALVYIMCSFNALPVHSIQFMFMRGTVLPLPAHLTDQHMQSDVSHGFKW